GADDVGARDRVGGDRGPADRDRTAPGRGRARRAAGLSMVKKIRLALTGVGYLIAWRLSRLAPEGLIRRIFDGLSLRSWKKNERRRNVVRENLHPGGRWVAERWPLTVVVEVLRPKMLFDRFVAHRRSLGMTIIPLVRGGDATAKCLERIRAGDYVALVSDRDLSGSGVPVRMFGRQTKMPSG